MLKVHSVKALYDSVTEILDLPWKTQHCQTLKPLTKVDNLAKVITEST